MGADLTHILLADDDIDNCLSFKEALEELPLNTGFSVVNDDAQLMNYLSETQQLPSVLFLDLNMPRKKRVACLHRKPIEFDVLKKTTPLKCCNIGPNLSTAKEHFFLHS